MEMVEVKVCDLLGAALDYMVEVAITGASPGYKHAFAWRYQNSDRRDYSRSWMDCGPLIDKYDPEERRLLPEKERFAEVWIDLTDGGAKFGRGTGPNRLIAFCRALVAAHFGDTVKVPADLVNT